MYTSSTKILKGLILILSLLMACTKDSGPIDTCAGKTINLTATSTFCSGMATSDGSISATATGSTGFVYSLNNGPFQADGKFNNLTIGNYEITAKDGNGCIEKATFEVSSAACPVLTFITNVQATSGPAANDGKITVSAANGGLAPYQYSIDGGQNYPGNGNTYAFTGLSAGNSYKITVKDANGCTTTSADAISIASVCALNLNLTTTGNDKCAGPNGSITANASGGSGNYQYSKDGLQYLPANTFNLLADGQYTIYVKDINSGCIVNKTADIALAGSGPLFTSVKAILNNKCIVCHHPGQINGQWGVSPDFTIDCNIVSNGLKIKNRAIDGNFQMQFMPPSNVKTITAAEETAILNWLNAGGKFIN